MCFGSTTISKWTETFHLKALNFNDHTLRNQLKEMLTELKKGGTE